MTAHDAAPKGPDHEDRCDLLPHVELHVQRRSDQAIGKLLFTALVVAGAIWLYRKMRS